MKYELSDQALSVMIQRRGLLEEIAAAIRVVHGDARSDWSESVGALKARLVAYRYERKYPSPVIKLYVEIYDVTGGDSGEKFDLSTATLAWQVTDKNGKIVSPNAPPSDWPPDLLADQKVVVEACDSRIARLPVYQIRSVHDTPSGWGGYLSVLPDKAWYFELSDKNTYSISCSITCPVTGQQPWSGTLHLPPMPIPTD